MRGEAPQWMEMVQLVQDVPESSAEYTLGARGGVLSQYITSTSQRSGQCTQHLPTGYISSMFRIFPANFHAVSPAQEMVSTFTVSQVM